ncbi:MAG: ATP-binding cassette domain-containing protein [Bacillota bacterium]|nr:ATP-binding cassette domain-containing protein [Bacillota bacterium]
MMALFRFDHVFYTADNSDVLQDVDLVIEPHDFIAITGPSGSGKSTFLKLCSNLISPTKGSIFYYEQDINTLEPTAYRREVAYCFQQPVLFGDTVRENLEFPFKIRNQSYDQEQVAALCERFGLPLTLIDKTHTNLSGGEKQRIALVRCLIFQPKVLLLDEITASLDRENALKVENAIHQMHAEGTTIVWVTHDPAKIDTFVNRQIAFRAGSPNAKEVTAP